MQSIREYYFGKSGKEWKHGKKGKCRDTEYRTRYFEKKPNNLEKERSKLDKSRCKDRKVNRAEKYEDNSCVVVAPAPAPALAPAPAPAPALAPVETVSVKIRSASDIAVCFVAKVREFLHCATNPSPVSDSEESEESEESEDYEEPSYGRPSKRKIGPYTQKHARKCAERASRKGVQTMKIEKRTIKGKRL